MTREEALQILDTIPTIGEQVDALELAIKALSAEPCEEHQREFIELVVEYPNPDLCTYPEYRGKPYFSIKYRENGKYIVGYGSYKIEMISQWIKEYFMPSIQPKPKTEWIPVSERLPEEIGEYLVTKKTSFSDYVYRSIAGYALNLHDVDEYDFEDKKRSGWYNYDPEYGYYELDDVIAWMPLVEPYKAESEDKE